MGYYLSWKKIRYHAMEDGLDCIRYYDTARYDNRGHFRLEGLSRLPEPDFSYTERLGKYCIDMEVNDISVLEYPCPKYVECSGEKLTQRLTAEDKSCLLGISLEDRGTAGKTADGRKNHENKILILTEPLCDLETKRIFRDIIELYGKGMQIILKPHPRDLLDYEKCFSGLRGVIRESSLWK